MWTDAARLVDDVSPADWTGFRLTRPPGYVGGTVPAGFAAYARILHPVQNWTSPGEESTTWGHVAEETGGVVHPLVQWRSLLGKPGWHRDQQWKGEWSPDEGNLPLWCARTLRDVLLPHTSTPDDAYFAVWDGYGELTGGGVVFGPDVPGGSQPIPPLLSEVERRGPRVEHPLDRTYHLCAGPLSALEQVGTFPSPIAPRFQTPNLWWPADRRWCVATEIDYDSTLVGGSRAAVDALLGSELEAFEVQLGDSLMWDADTRNPPRES